MLAGVSVDYYTRLERGDLSGASDAVLDALARALQLDEAEIAHLYDLARQAKVSPAKGRARTASTEVRPSLHRLLDAITGAPAIIRNDYFDYVAANALGRALYSPVFADSHPNSARFAFLSPEAPDFFTDWDRVTRDLVATMRQVAGHNPFDKRMTDLVGELTTRSPHFSALWAAHNVRFHRSGTKKLHHPIVGDIELTFESFELPADPGLSLSTYTAMPGTSSSDALTLLATWAASGDVSATTRE